MNKKQKSLNNKGFSLVELIIVVAIMAVLVGVLAPTYLGYVEKSKKSTDVQNAQELATSIAVKAAIDDSAITTSTVTAINATNINTISELTTVPEIKVGSSYAWYYEYDGVEVTIYLGDGTNTYEVYPTVATGSPWEQ